jgi:hypothetical protein
VLLVVSGSNMSGKSTFLRTVGVNAVLALAGAPVRAGRLRISPLAIGATLRVQDSLQRGQSRFYAEITRLRQIDLDKGPAPVLFLLDELLSGTNSEDGRAGAEAVLRRLVDTGAIGLVTTHDLALTSVADGLGSAGADVHFDERLEGDRLAFDYTLRPGSSAFPTWNPELVEEDRVSLFRVAHQFGERNDLDVDAEFGVVPKIPHLVRRLRQLSVLCLDVELSGEVADYIGVHGCVGRHRHDLAVAILDLSGFEVAHIPVDLCDGVFIVVVVVARWPFEFNQYHGPKRGALIGKREWAVEDDDVRAISAVHFHGFDFVQALVRGEVVMIGDIGCSRKNETARSRRDSAPR